MDEIGDGEITSRFVEEVIPGGSCYSVGLGGHICGGGYGLLSRKFGLTIDYLSGVDIVCVDSANKVACKKLRKGSTVEEDQDLLWACKGGGGGNYGIITCYYFENLPPAPQNAYLVTVSIDWNGLTLQKFQTLLDILWDIVSINEPFFAILHIMHISAGEIPFLFQSAFDKTEYFYENTYSRFIEGGGDLFQTFGTVVSLSLSVESLCLWYQHH